MIGPKARLALAVVSLMGLIPPGCRRASPRPAPTVAVVDSFLASAVRDLLGDSARVMRLAEPGMCPGHFDVRPSQIAVVRRCRVLLYQDFQKALAGRLERATGGRLRIVEVGVPEGLCRPQTYLTACAHTAKVLVDVGLLSQPAAERRLRDIRRRLERLGARQLRRVAALKGTAVVASVHQEAFCRWLGLEVVATFRGADVESAARLERALRAARGRRVRWVIANLPEGRRAADFLAERLGAEVVVFGNFPAPGRGHGRFDDLLTDNVSRLLEAARR